MPLVPGFSNNPILTRSDLILATQALLRPLNQYKSPQGARIKIPVETAAHFDETAAQLEGFARPLWAVACLLYDSGPRKCYEHDLLSHPGDLVLGKDQSHLPGFNNASDQDSLLSWLRGLMAGTDPSLPDEYWGEVGDHDQRMVEMEIISFALLAAPGAFWPSGNSDEDLKHRERIIAWLQGINGKSLPRNNWLWFRVMTNLALIKTCGVPHEELRDAIDTDLGVLDSFEMEGENGWNSDGLWDQEGKQADYYSGSFAIQYSQLLFVKFASDIDLVRAARYKKRAGMFAIDFMRYFDENGKHKAFSLERLFSDLVVGAAIPFGRSLTYRFAMGAFWAVVALADVWLPAPLDTLGAIKGLLLRHLRYWAAQTGIFHADGTLNVGYHFPNAFMCENYNSPQSPYWSMKTLVAISLATSHPFWMSEELPHPLYKADGEVEVKALEAPLQILCHSGNHHFMLSSGQFISWPMKASQAKYGKFAYSSTFGFSVPTGPLMSQIAPDSTLALSNDEEETWRVRGKTTDAHISSVTLTLEDGAIQDIQVLKSKWEPWKMKNIVVETTLIPATKKWPDWHVRIHRIIGDNEHRFIAMEGGFAILGWQKEDERDVPLLHHQSGSILPREGKFETERDALVLSSAGASGIRNLIAPTRRQGVVLKPDANTNLISQRTLIPMLRSIVDNDYEHRCSTLVTGVFGIAARKYGTQMEDIELTRRWDDAPVVLFNSSGTERGCHFIL
jgi:hypothetical protein